MALYSAITREIQRGPSGPKVGAFFDVDHTILASFSAFAFLRERVTSGRMSPRDFAEQLTGGIGFAAGRIGFSGLVTATTGMYRGLAESALEQLGEEVFEKHLATQIYPESRALVKAHQDMGHTVCIVSSATQFQVMPLARELGIEHVMCTRLEAEDGIITGRVEHPSCWGDGKAIHARMLARERDVDLERSYFYTDSHDDLPLLEAVGHPRPLNPSRKLSQIAAERGWPVRTFHSRGAPSLSEVARTGFALASALPTLAASVQVGLLNRSRRQAANLALGTISDFTTAVLQVDLRVEGEQHLWSHRPAVFLFNHQSGIDTLLLARLLRRDFVGIAKQELRWNPLFGPVASLMGTVFVDRLNHDRAVEQLKPALDALKGGLSIVIAPEGTRSRTPRPGAFKKGAFHIAMQAGVPIVPIVFRNALDALPRGGGVVRPAHVEAVVLPPIPTDSWKVEDLNAHIEGVRQQFLEVLDL